MVKVRQRVANNFRFGERSRASLCNQSLATLQHQKQVPASQVEPTPKAAPLEPEKTKRQNSKLSLSLSLQFGFALRATIK